MAAAKKYSPEQIVAKLREHEKLQGQGLTIPQACKRIGITDQTFCRWRSKYGALKEDEAHRLKSLEQENARLKRSGGRASLLVSTVRRNGMRWSPTLELQLAARMNELAAQYPRYGYRRIWALLRSEGFAVNKKRVERLWRLEGHKVPPTKGKHGQKAIGGRAGSTWNLQATRPNEIWSDDFVAARTDDGLPLRILNVVDEFTRRCLGCHVDRNVGAGQIAEVLAGLFARHGPPRLIRSDNGREFLAASLKA